MTQTISKQETILFGSWKYKRPGFRPDGLINEKEYLKRKPKILFLLKEPLSKRGKHLDMRDFLAHAENRKNPTWDSIGRWIYGIRKIKLDLSWDQLDKALVTTKQKIEIMRSFCFINMKKTFGGSLTKEESFYNIVEQDKFLIQQQFDFYKPDLIISCGNSVTQTFTDFIDIPNKDKWQMTRQGIKYFEFGPKKFFIAFAHPDTNIIEDNILYYALINAVRELF